jgi:hypothetical protein
MFNKLIISLNKARGAVRKSRATPDEILVLVPHCLQNHDCTCDIVKDIGNCKQCGKCKIAELVKIRDKYGVKVAVAKGGQQACLIAGGDEIKVIVAVACEKELAAGILALPKKKIYAIPNILGETPCVDTDVEIEKVESMLQRVINEGHHSS